MSDDAVSDNTPISQRAPFGEGARVKVVRCHVHSYCGFVGGVGTVVRVDDVRRRVSRFLVQGAEVRFDGETTLWYFAIDDLEEIR